MPLNDDAPPPTLRERVDIAVMNHADIVAVIGLTASLAIAFTVMGAPDVALGIFLGVVVALAIGMVR